MQLQENLIKRGIIQSSGHFSHVKKILWSTDEGKFAVSPALAGTSNTVSIFLHLFLSHQDYTQSTRFMTVGIDPIIWPKCFARLLHYKVTLAPPFLHCAPQKEVAVHSRI